ncbi:TonB-dependent receptor [Lewinella sp. W8]|uniref:TonB-dependent receptor domain-containing protein n=1 Tax=Lewinella sp. W8 TaxID=2528208 RepID=UPI0015658B24|nr:TonB-dependent receptor [Lewinella sp. W8]
MTIRFLLTTLFIFPLIFLQAQPSAPENLAIPDVKGTITGVVVDANDGTPVGYATVSLYAGEDIVNGTITEDDGKFEISGVDNGTYRIDISFIGYETITLTEVEVKGKKTDLGTIQLGTAAALLEEVTVTGQRALIEEKVDRLVYNAEQDQLSRGGDAADVLRRVPLLQVDLEGNVSLRGSSNIQVLINNKPSTIVAGSVADAMKMIPADQIKSVEVITSPSAKYDAEGAGGIINIITKKNSLQGYFLNVDTGAGIRGSNLGLQGSYRSGKFGMTLGGFGRAFYNEAETKLTQEFVNSSTVQFGDADDNGIFGRFNLGLDYDISENQFLSGGVRYGVRNFSREQLQTTDVLINDELASTFLRNIDADRASGTYDFNLDYLKRFAPGHEFSISTLYSTTSENSDFISADLDDNNAIERQLENINDNNNREFTVQADYILPLGETQIIEVGAKGIMRMVNSDFSYLSAEGNGDFVLDPTRPAGILDYDQNIAAAYAAYTLQLPGEVTVKAGLRFEQTMLEASQNGEAINLENYNNLVPSVNMSKRLSDRTTVKLGYSQRLQRPWLRQLNPNVNLQNSQSIEVGNPLLLPELTDNLELGLSTSLGKTYLNVSFFGRNSNNAINQVRYPVDSLDGTLLTTYANIGKEQAIGTNIFLNVYLTKNWTINGGIDLDYAFLEGQVINSEGVSVAASNSGLNYGGRLMSTLKLNNGWSGQAFTFMRGRRQQLQGFRGGFGMYALGINKEFNDGKGSIGLAAENFLARGWTLRSELQTASFSQIREDVLLNRNIKITFGYKFGDLDASRTRKKTRGVSNDDLMGGGDENGGGQGAAPAPQQSRRQIRRSNNAAKKAEGSTPKKDKETDEEKEKSEEKN